MVARFGYFLCPCKFTSRNTVIPYFFQKFGQVSQNLLSAAVVIGALRVNLACWVILQFNMSICLLQLIFTSTAFQNKPFGNITKVLKA